MRLYVIQIHSSARNWQDLGTDLKEVTATGEIVPFSGQWAFKKEHEGIRAATTITEKTGRPTRVIRKPHGWTPS